MFEINRTVAVVRPALWALAGATMLLSPLSPVTLLAPTVASAEESVGADVSSEELWLAQAEAAPEDRPDQDSAAADENTEAADAGDDAEDAGAASQPGGKTLRRKFMLAKRLAAMEVAVGIRTEQLEVWRDFSDALIAAVPDYDHRGRGGPRGPGGQPGPGAAPGPQPDLKPTDRIRRMAQRMVENGAKAVTLLNALDALKAKLTPEQLERFGQFERMLMHRGGPRRHGAPNRGSGRWGHGEHGKWRDHRPTHYGRGHGMMGGHQCPHHERGDGDRGPAPGSCKHACPHHGMGRPHHPGPGMGMGHGPGMGRGHGMGMCPRGAGAGHGPMMRAPDAPDAPPAPQPPPGEPQKPNVEPSAPPPPAGEKGAHNL